MGDIEIRESIIESMTYRAKSSGYYMAQELQQVLNPPGSEKSDLVQDSRLLHQIKTRDFD